MSLCDRNLPKRLKRLIIQRHQNKITRCGITVNPSFRILILKIAYRFKLLVAKLTRMPIVGKIIYYSIFKDDRLIYLPMDKVIQVNQILTPSRININDSFPQKKTAKIRRVTLALSTIDNKCIEKSINHISETVDVS